MTACSMTGQFDHDGSCGWQRRVDRTDGKRLDDILDEPQRFADFIETDCDPRGDIAIQ